MYIDLYIMVYDGVSQIQTQASESGIKLGSVKMLTLVCVIVTAEYDRHTGTLALLDFRNRTVHASVVVVNKIVKQPCQSQNKYC